ncbi:MAG: four helix bundle protein [Chitinophagaceae bacterium]|nr:four helix bundle protein [Chitinophagaceae bacterium]
MNKFKDLSVWQKSIELAEAVYQLTTNFPVEEKFGLQSQIRRCVVSIASNISEGAGRNSKKEFRYFFSISLGSSYELETQLILAARFNYFNNDSLIYVLEKLNEVQKMIVGLSKSLV